eukprot:14829096-Ditylum_brightwellii.AAC.1
MNLLKKAQEDNSKLLRIIKASVTGTKPPGGSRKGKRRENFEKTDHLMEPEGYCWSCGYRVPKNHNSINCDKQKPGHQLGAMRANIMGGNCINHWWKPK